MLKVVTCLLIIIVAQPHKYHCRTKNFNESTLSKINQMCGCGCAPGWFCKESDNTKDFCRPTRKFISTNYGKKANNIGYICEAKLVRRTDTTSWHPATDQLAGTDAYGTKQDTKWSVPFYDEVFDVFIFTTRNHKYMMAMTKEQVGGPWTNSYYGSTDRDFYKMLPSDTVWVAHKAIQMNYRNKIHPWLGVTDHDEYDGVLYGGDSFDASHEVSKTMIENGGADVYILTLGSLDVCVIGSSKNKIRVIQPGAEDSKFI